MNKLKTHFDDTFFEEEKRCDYLVTSRSKKIWAIQIDLFNELFRVCRSHDIKVCAFSGTILGAVRHKGFIPWDDDLDVCMDRKNYEKLLKFSYEFKEPYFLQTSYNDTRFFCGYARLRNSLTTGIVKWERSVDYNNGIYIDIYILDGYIEDKKLLKKQLKRRDHIIKMINLYHCDYAGLLKSIIGRVLRFFIKRIAPYEYWLRKYDECISMYNGATNRVGLMTHIPIFIEKYWCYQNDLDDIVMVPYENIMMPIPKEYDSILQNMYGDYMKYPPLEQRGGWHGDIIEFDPDTPYKEYFKQL
ncbi:MAG: LicD family protein [Lachnospiraceae bacterium]|nr:LicD family protein [Lachnospiraceae bacterium]